MEESANHFRNTFEVTSGTTSKAGQAIPPIDIYALQALADAGDSQAMTDLAHCYFYGQHVSLARERGLHLYRSAAGLGNLEAQYSLGLYHMTKCEDVTDIEFAVKWFTLAAAGGFVAAQKELGVIYDEGPPGIQDLHRAYFWYLLASQHGDRDSVERLAAIANKVSDSEQKRIRFEVEEWIEQH